ncbi:NAD dependent epimerase/dehydratase family-domain-containing protein [Mycena rebaudengoi]|nr:NAD dependent epimerase/dehydratase family-domain-containing protein [Mycena rebaudengoi]
MITVVLVTGGTGLVGKALQHIIETEPTSSRYEKLPNETWIFMGSLEGDLRDPEQTRELYEKYTYPYNPVGGLFKNMKHKLTFLRDNPLINDNYNILHTSYTHKTIKLISCLSTCVFPDEVESPLEESKIHGGAPHESNFGYAHAKHMVDVLNHAYKEEYGCNFTSAIPTNIFGPHDNYVLEDAHVIPALIHKCYLAKKNGTPFVLFIWMLREYEDVEAVILSINSPLLFGEYEEVSIKEVTDAIVKALGFEGNYSFDTMKSDGQFRKPASNKKLLDLMGGSSLHRLRRVHFWFVIDAQSDLNNGSSGYQCEMVRG